MHYGSIRAKVSCPGKHVETTQPQSAHLKDSFSVTLQFATLWISKWLLRVILLWVRYTRRYRVLTLTMIDKVLCRQKQGCVQMMLHGADPPQNTCCLPPPSPSSLTFLHHPVWEAAPDVSWHLTVLSCSHTVSLLHERCSIVRGGYLEVKYFIYKSLCDFSLIPNFLNPSLFCNTRRICLQKKEMGLSPHTRSLSQSILCRLFFPLRVPSAALLQPGALQVVMSWIAFSTQVKMPDTEFTVKRISHKWEREMRLRGEPRFMSLHIMTLLKGRQAGSCTSDLL